MAQGGIDHPSYITRQTYSMPTTVAGSGTSAYSSVPFAIHIRQITGAITVAGTGAALNATPILMAGTVALATMTFGTHANAATVGLLGTVVDAAASVAAGTLLSVANTSTPDLTYTAHLSFEYYLDAQATWTGNN